jgi:hypothetical protein
LKRLTERRVLNRISPIQIKTGREARPHREVCAQMVVAMASPTGREVNPVIASKPTPKSDKPIQRPDPRKTRSARMRSMVNPISNMISTSMGSV